MPGININKKSPPRSIYGNQATAAVTGNDNQYLTPSDAMNMSISPTKKAFMNALATSLSRSLSMNSFSYKSLGRSLSQMSYGRSPLFDIYQQFKQHSVTRPTLAPCKEEEDVELLQDIEANFCKDFTCCGIVLKDLHELLQHFEDAHRNESDMEEEDDLPFEFDDFTSNAGTGSNQNSNNSTPNGNRHLGNDNTTNGGSRDKESFIPTLTDLFMKDLENKQLQQKSVIINRSANTSNQQQQQAIAMSDIYSENRDNSSTPSSNNTNSFRFGDTSNSSMASENSVNPLSNRDNNSNGIMNGLFPKFNSTTSTTTPTTLNTINSTNSFAAQLLAGSTTSPFNSLSSTSTTTATALSHNNSSQSNNSNNNNSNNNGGRLVHPYSKNSTMDQNVNSLLNNKNFVMTTTTISPNSSSSTNTQQSLLNKNNTSKNNTLINIPVNSPFNIAPKTNSNFGNNSTLSHLSNKNNALSGNGVSATSSVANSTLAAMTGLHNVQSLQNLRNLTQSLSQQQNENSSNSKLNLSSHNLTHNLSSNNNTMNSNSSNLSKLQNHNSTSSIFPNIHVNSNQLFNFAEVANKGGNAFMMNSNHTNGTNGMDDGSTDYDGMEMDMDMEMEDANGNLINDPLLMAEAGSDEEKKYRCQIPGCNKTYKNPGGLKYHLQHGHFEDTGDPEMNKIMNKPFQCNVENCGKRYKNLNGLKYHIEHSHMSLLFNAQSGQIPGIPNSNPGTPGGNNGSNATNSNNINGSGISSGTANGPSHLNSVSGTDPQQVLALHAQTFNALQLQQLQHLQQHTIN